MIQLYGRRKLHKLEDSVEYLIGYYGCMSTSAAPIYLFAGGDASFYFVSVQRDAPVDSTAELAFISAVTPFVRGKDNPPRPSAMFIYMNDVDANTEDPAVDF